MNAGIRQILDQITALEKELQDTVAQQEGHLRYRIENKGIVFEQAIKEAHQKVKLGVFRWFLTVRPQNYLTMPIIYGAAIPLMLFDLSLSFYQMTSFPIYRIAKVKRADYIVYDHHLLGYLNFIEKAHCLYCSYAVGMLAYAGEIVARTEQYFCPIKHARKVLAEHSRYEQFLRYGDEEDFHGKLEKFRSALAEETRSTGEKQK
jgi:hypothetical protein